MRYAFQNPHYTYTSDEYWPVPFSVPNFERLLSAGRNRKRQMPDAAELIKGIGFDNSSHITSRASFPEHDKLLLFPKRHLIPLCRTGEHGSDFNVEIVRSYGRGYVQPNVRINLDGREESGALAIKGSGVGAWAMDNKHWVVQENQKRGLIIGLHQEQSFVHDLLGEFWARKAGLKCPVTVYCAKRKQGYQVGRLWHCPYRLWELTSGPFRFGPRISQPFVLLNWGIELAFALKHRDTISARADECFGKLSAATNIGRVDHVASLERNLIQNIVKLTVHGYQLLPFALHLANIAYSGETTGFDRIQGPFSRVEAFRLGILTGLLETWAAISWVRSIMGKSPLPFWKFFQEFQQQIEASGTSTARSFLEASHASEVFSKVNIGRRLEPPLELLFFSVRSEGDIENFVFACETFFDGLMRTFSGEFDNLRDLYSWRGRVDFARCEEVRISQSMAGDILRGRRTQFLCRVREEHMLEKRYVTTNFRN